MKKVIIPMLLCSAMSFAEVSTNSELVKKDYSFKSLAAQSKESLVAPNILDVGTLDDRIRITYEKDLFTGKKTTTEFSNRSILMQGLGTISEKYYDTINEAYDDANEKIKFAVEDNNSAEIEKLQKEIEVLSSDCDLLSKYELESEQEMFEDKKSPELKALFKMFKQSSKYFCINSGELLRNVYDVESQAIKKSKLVCGDELNLLYSTYATSIDKVVSAAIMAEDKNIKDAKDFNEYKEDVYELGYRTMSGLEDAKTACSYKNAILKEMNGSDNDIHTPEVGKVYDMGTVQPGSIEDKVPTVDASQM